MYCVLISSMSPRKNDVYRLLFFIPCIRWWIIFPCGLIAEISLHLTFMLTIFCSCLLSNEVHTSIYLVFLHCLWGIQGLQVVLTRPLVNISAYSCQSLPLWEVQQLFFDVTFLRYSLLNQR